jgi:polyribonucleotide nucleotidyltransferase
MSIHKVSCEMGGKTLSIETGKMAKQADGSVLVSYGDTRVLVTACSAKEPNQVRAFSLSRLSLQKNFTQLEKSQEAFIAVKELQQRKQLFRPV